jgi:hypothetical protein
VSWVSNTTSGKNGKDLKKNWVVDLGEKAKRWIFLSLKKLKLLLPFLQRAQKAHVIE